jgi:hypothetical protein
MRQIINKVYILEIGDRPILSYEADSFNDARSLIKEKWLQSDLKKARSHGATVWDGKTPLVVRNSSVAETEIFAAGKKAADDSDDMLIVYLIELDS